MKKSYKIVLPLLTLLLTGAVSMAAPVSPQRALERLQKDSPARIIPISASPLRLAHTLYAGGESSVYVFNSTDGFVVAPADDLAPAVLGYSDNGGFDPSTASPGLMWLLGEYSRQ